MLPGDFARKLKALNKNVHVYCRSNMNNRAAGIFHVVGGVFTSICGIDKNFVPEHSVKEPNGNIIKGGWRRALKILIEKGLIDRKAAEWAFSRPLHYRGPNKNKKPKRSIPLGRRIA